MYDAYRDDPEFGYRFLADEVRAAGFEVSDRVVWRICRDMGWWSEFGKPRARKASKPGTPAHDDLVHRKFTADAPNDVWVADLTEHRTAEGKGLPLRDQGPVLEPGRLLGHRPSNEGPARGRRHRDGRRRPRRCVAGCIFHTDRGSQGELNWPGTRSVPTGVHASVLAGVPLSVPQPDPAATPCLGRSSRRRPPAATRRGAGQI
jgi:putative transposase